jgi:hypothetical protein
VADSVPYASASSRAVQYARGRSHTGRLPSSSCDAFLPAPSHTAPRPTAFPASPRVFPHKRNTDARPAVILGLQGSSPEPPDQPAKTQNFLRVLFRVGFAKTAGRAGGSGRAAKTEGLRRTNNTSRAATTTGRGFDASYGAKLSGTAGGAGGGARADPKSYPRTETKPRFTH